jgi:hypothetical protein
VRAVDLEHETLRIEIGRRSSATRPAMRTAPRSTSASHSRRVPKPCEKRICARFIRTVATACEAGLSGRHRRTARISDSPTRALNVAGRAPQAGVGRPGPPMPCACVTARSTARAVASAAAMPSSVRSGLESAPPVARQNSVSPSLIVWTGLMLRASPSCAICAILVASALVSAASVAMTPIVVAPPS